MILPGSNSSSDAVVDTLRLEVHPSVVFKLGSDLISDDMQALIELIKNAYDADASKVHVGIDTHVLTDAITGAVITEDDKADPDKSMGERPTRKQLCGRIIIEDNGVGMDFDTIKRGWLTISLSHKQAMKARGETTKKKRTPLGDKGLGRLGAQRLGQVLTMTTRPRQGSAASSDDSSTLRVSIEWSRFAAADTMNAVPLTVYRLPHEPSQQFGTTLEIRGLRDPDFWRENETNDLQRELAAMISPYSGVSGFQMTLTIDGISINLREKAEAILASTPAAYQLEFDGGTLVVEGRFSSEFLRPQGRENNADRTYAVASAVEERV